MACRMILVHIPNRIPGVTYIARLRVMGSQNIPADGSIYYKVTTSDTVRFEGVPDNFYEVGISMQNSVGAETAIEWQPVASFDIGVPTLTVSNITGTGFQVDFTAVNGATGYEYSIDYGPWLSLGVPTAIVVANKTAGKVYRVDVRAVIAGRRGYIGTTSVLTTPGNANAIHYVERVKTVMNGGVVAYHLNRLVIANALKAVAQSYTLTNGFTLGSKVVGGGDTYATIATALTESLELKSQIDAATYSYVDFRDYADAGRSSSTPISFVVS